MNSRAEDLMKLPVLSNSQSQHEIVKLCHHSKVSNINIIYMHLPGKPGSLHHIYNYNIALEDRIMILPEKTWQTG